MIILFTTILLIHLACNGWRLNKEAAVNTLMSVVAIAAILIVEAILFLFLNKK